MAFNTKIELYDGKVYQGDGHTLTLSGDTIIATSGDLRYQTHPTFTADTQIVDKCYVDSSTGALGANNGLTRRGNNITLGGALTGATTITAGAGTSLLFTDTRTPSIGIQYGGDYSAGYTQRSLVDAAYVTGRTSQAILTANNGLTKTGTAVQLGGALTKNTNIQLGANSIIYSASTVNQNVTISPTLASLGQAIWCEGDMKFCGCSYLVKTPTCFETRMDTTDQIAEISQGAGCLLFKQYNGLCCNKICASPNGIDILREFGTSGAQSKLMLCEWYTTLTSCNATAGCSANITVCGQEGLTFNTYAVEGQSSDIIQTPCAITVGSTYTNFAGMQYAGNYRSKFVCNSLVDAAYVTGKTNTITTNYLNAATNGLTKSGNSVELGGTLTKQTTINGAQTLRFNVSTLNITGSTGFALSTANGVITDTGNKGGLQYAANYGSCVVARSIPDAQWVTGKTSTIATDLSNNYYNRTCINSYTGKTNTRLNTIEADYVTGSTNGISSADVHRVKLGGAITENTTLSGAFLLAANMNRVNITGSTGGVNLGGTVSLKTQPTTALGDILTINTTTGLIGKTVLSSLGGLTGATNGIGTTGQKVCLGGALVAATTFSGAYAMNFCNTGGILMRGTSDMVMDGQSNAGLILKSQSGTVATSTDFTNAIGINIDFNGAGGFNIIDNRAGAAATGIVYNADYSTNYTARSLVDKNYVDTIATGLQVHTAAKVATTGPITLANTQTIDGVVVSNPDRVLVKNQADATTNGLYTVVNAGAWTRTADFDGTPANEISNGDLIPVTSGSTQNNSIWVLTSKNPIIVGTTNLVFTQFSTVIDIQAGSGIAITQVGGQHSACVLLGGGIASTASCGLAVSTNGLCVSSTIAGCGLTYTNGVLCVNATTGGATAAIPVKFNASCGLVINCADINTALNAITGATNGLTKTGQCVKLGGAISEVTTLTLNAGTTGLNITDSRVGSTAVGIQYSGNYGTNFTARSIPDAAWVTGKTTTSGIQTADNGLTKTGTNVQLGGLLTQETVIGITTNSLVFSGACATETPGVSCYYGMCITPNSLEFGDILGNDSNWNRVLGVTPNSTYLISGDDELTDCSALNMRSGSGVQLASYKCDGSTYDNSASIILNTSFGGGRGVSITTQEYCQSTNSAIHMCETGYINMYTNQSTGIHLDGTYNAENICLGLRDTTNICLAGSAEGITPSSISLHSAGGTYENPICGDIIQTASALTISSNYSGFTGTQYFADYSANFIARSLVDAAYVTGKTNAIATNYVCSANNGLTKQGTNVRLGGTLTGTTTISAGANAFNVTNTNGNDLCVTNSCIRLGTTTNYFNHTSTDTIIYRESGAFCNCMAVTNNCIYIATDSNSGHRILEWAENNIGIKVSDANYINFTELRATPTTFTVIGEMSTFGGIKYSDNYSGLFTARSLVDAAWVTGKTSTSGVQTANNGLTKQGTNVRLGGVLTGNTTITGAYTLNICSGAKLNTACGYQISGSTMFRTSPASLSNIYIGLNSGGGATGGACNIGIGMYTLSGNTTGNYNVAIGACSLRKNTSGEFNNALGYSLVANTTGSWNNAFGTNVLQANTSGCQNNGFGAAAMSLNTTGCGNNAFGSNALQSNTSGHYNVSLGDSTLYDNTTGSRNTAVGTNALTYNTTGKCNTSVGGNSMWCNCTGSGNTAMGSSGLYRNKIGCNNVAIGYQAGYTATGSSKLYIANNSGSTLIYGDFATNEVTLPTLKLSATPASGTINDSVLVWNSSDKIVKSVNGAALGDKNNIYSTTAVTTNVTLHSGSSYVVFVNNSAPATLTLPATPRNGQAFKIKNASGSSLTNPITVAGNGRNIDGSPNALINTDYGALELVYQSTLNAWFSLSFIN